MIFKALMRRQLPVALLATTCLSIAVQASPSPASATNVCVLSSYTSGANAPAGGLQNTYGYFLPGNSVVGHFNGDVLGGSPVTYRMSTGMIWTGAAILQNYNSTASAINNIRGWYIYTYAC